MLTTDQLREAMITSAGEDESVTLEGDFATKDFAELGFDSLALMATCATLKRRFGIEIPDETLWELTTPEQLVAWVNGARP